jgi:hypothetical protein
MMSWECVEIFTNFVSEIEMSTLIISTSKFKLRIAMHLLEKVELSLSRANILSKLPRLLSLFTLYANGTYSESFLVGWFSRMYP